MPRRRPPTKIGDTSFVRGPDLFRRERTSAVLPASALHDLFRGDARSVIELYDQLTSNPRVAPPTPDDIDHARREVERALRNGQLVGLQRQMRLRGDERLVLGNEPVADAPPESIPEETTTWFEVRLLDEGGAPLDGSELVFSMGSKSKPAVTNAAGIARVDGVEGSFGSVRPKSIEAIRSQLISRWDAGLLPADPPAEAHIAIVPVRNFGSVSLQSETRKTIVLVRSTYRARLIGFFFDTNKAFILPHAMNGIRGVKRLFDRHPGAEMLVVGHTDTTGTPDYNDKLSLERARSVVQYLTNDYAPWLAWFDASQPTQKRWGTMEVQLMLTALPEGGPPFYDGEPNGVKDAKTRAAVKAFQVWSNETRDTALAIDGNAGSETREALVRAYMALEDTTLPDGTTISAAGGGESFPEDPTPDCVADPDNRRTEVFVFEDGVHPPPPGEILPPGSPEYAIWRKQVVDTLDVEHAGLRVRVVDDAGNVIPNARVTLEGPHSDDDVSDAGGLVTFFNLPTGSYVARAFRDGFLAGESPFVYPPDPEAEAALGKPTPKLPPDPSAAGGTTEAFGDDVESEAPKKTKTDDGSPPAKTDQPPGQDVVVVVEQETTLVLNVRDKSAAPIEGVEVTITPPTGASATSGTKAKSDATGRVEFKLSKGGDVKVATPKIDPFDAATSTIALKEKDTTYEILALETSYTLKHRYLWQNKAIRPTVFADRETMLRRFLSANKDFELSDPAKIPTGSSAKAAKNEYQKKIDAFSHKQLVNEMLDVFDADVSNHHEKWVRYMVAHFSGLHYDSAHSNFADPRRLLPVLTREEWADTLADASKTSAKRLLEIAREARSTVAKAPADYKGQKTDALPGKAMDPDPGKSADMTESDVADPKNAKKVTELRTKIASFFELTARAGLKSLGDEEVLGIVNSRAPTTTIASRRVENPPWNIVLTLTWLRNDAASIGDLVVERKDADAVVSAIRARMSAKKSVTFAERAVQEWYGRDITQWRAFHLKTLEPNFTRAVCNEIDEISLHARNVEIRGGITLNAIDTANKSAAKALSSLVSVPDYVPRASIFFARWSTFDETKPSNDKFNKWRDNSADFFDVRTAVSGGIWLEPKSPANPAGRRFDPAAGIPWQVTRVAAKMDAKGVTITWDAVPGATTYDVFVGSVFASPPSVSPTASVTKTSFVDPGASAGTTRFYAVRAVNAAGGGPLSRVIGLTFELAATNRPTGLLATTQMNGEIKLQWRTVSGPKYRLYADASGVPPSSGVPIAEVTSPEFTHSVATPAGVKWRYFVTAIDFKGVESAPSGLAGAESGEFIGATLYFGDVFTYHVGQYTPKGDARFNPPHVEIQRTYKSTTALNTNSDVDDYEGTPSGDKVKTNLGEPDVRLDVFHWVHEAATIEVGTTSIHSFETSSPTGYNNRFAPLVDARNSSYTGLVDKQDPSNAALDSFLDRKELTSKCDDD